MPKTGKTTGNLKMRSGPGLQFEPPIAFLVPDTQLEILAEQGDWLHVRAAGQEGYVGRKYVEISETASLGHATLGSAPAADERQRGGPATPPGSGGRTAGNRGPGLERK